MMSANMNSERDELEEQAAIVAMFFKSIIVHGVKNELPHKAILEAVWVQCQELLRGSNIDMEFPEAFPVEEEEDPL
jgi:hypothetical protein